MLKQLPDLRNRIMPLHLVLLCGCLLLGAWLRLHALQAHGLWFDEILTALRSREDVGWLLWGSPPVRFRPVSYLITHFFLLLFGESDFIVRLPSVMEGILGLAVMYKMGATLYGRREGLLGALLLALSPFHICYSQEARFYALLLLLSLLTVLFLWKALAGGNRWFWVAFLVTTALNVYNHPVACFVLVAELAFVGLMWLWKRRITGFRLSLHFISGALILGLVLLMVGPLYYAALPQDVKFPLVLPGGEEGPTVRLSSSLVLNLFSAFGAGSGLALYAFAEIALLGLLLSSRPGARKVLLLLLSMMCVPLLVLPFVRGAAPFAYKYFIFILPLYLLLVARGMSGLGEIIHYAAQSERERSRHGFPSRISRTGLRSHTLMKPTERMGNAAQASIITITPGDWDDKAQSVTKICVGWFRSSLGKAIPVAVFLLLVSLDLVAVSDYYRERTEDWREMGAFLRQNARPGEIIVSPLVYPEPYLTSGAHILSYYTPVGQEGVALSVTTSLADLEETYLRHARVWLVLVPPYTALPAGTTDWLSGHEYVEYSFYPRFKVLCLNNDRRDRSTEAFAPSHPLTAPYATGKGMKMEE